MIIRAFRKSYLIQYLFLLVLQLVLWLGAFFSPIAPEPVNYEYLAPGFTVVMNLIGQNALASTILAFVLVLLGALVFNYTLEIRELSAKNSLIPAMFFILVMSIHPSLLTVHPALIATLILIIVLYNTFAIYTEEEAYAKVFYSGLLIAISSLFYFPSIYFLVFLWLTFISFRLYKWREWILVLFGFFTPYILIWAYYFWFDMWYLQMDDYYLYFNRLTLIKSVKTFSILDYVLAGMISVLFLNAFSRISINLQENIISVRKRFWSASLFFLIALISILFSGRTAETHLTILYLSMSVVTIGLFFRLRRFFWTELYLGILILLIILNNYAFAFKLF